MRRKYPPISALGLPMTRPYFVSTIVVQSLESIRQKLGTQNCFDEIRSL